MSDILERKNKLDSVCVDDCDEPETCPEIWIGDAADEIFRQRAEIARLRTALDLIAESYAEPETDYTRGIKQIACAALKEET